MTKRITGGLRTWTSDHFGVGDWRYESIMKFADRIEAKLAERYVEMPAKVDGQPKDIDGEIWHYGDKAESVLFPKTAPRTVCGFGVINGRHVLFYLSENCSGHTSELHQGWDYADSVRHYVPDTWERIIEDARAYSMNIGGSYLWTNKSDELVARCKALAGSDGE